MKRRLRGTRYGRSRKGELHSDLELACGEGDTWGDIREQAAAKIVQFLRLKITTEKPICKQLGSYGGDVHFLPAYPWELPATGDLEPDVLEYVRVVGVDLQVDGVDGLVTGVGDWVGRHVAARKQVALDRASRLDR